MDVFFKTSPKFQFFFLDHFYNFNDYEFLFDSYINNNNYVTVDPSYLSSVNHYVRKAFLDG